MERAGRGAAAASPIDPFVPRWDARERHGVRVRAPADATFAAAERFDLLAVPAVRAIFRLRAWAMRAAPPPERSASPFLAEMQRIGWGVLARAEGRAVVCGAVTRPWEGDVVFRPVPAAEFAAFSEPDLVKIAWTIEVEPLGPARCRLATETRAVATDEGARRRFRRYWRLAGAGIVLVRWLALPAIRRDAERRLRAAR